MFLKIERQTIKKEKNSEKKKLNMIEIIEIKKSVIKHCIFFQFMYKNIEISVTLTLNLEVSGGLNYFSLKCIVVV